MQIVSAPRPAGDIKLITSGSDAVACLAKNLLSIGLKVSAAPIFAQEALAAVVTGRVLFCKGSFAPDVARVLAVSLAGAHVQRVRVPVGYVDASHLDRQVVDVLPPARDSAAVLLLDRVNNAPLEVFADAIDELTRADNVFVLGTLSEGVSALPEHPLYLQYGPVFDTDALDWSLFVRPGLEISAGALASLNSSSLSMDLAKARPSNEELLRLLRKVPLATSPRLERQAVAYMAALEAFRKSAEPTSLQSLAFAWLWPLWRMTDVSWDDCEEELMGGRVDGETADQRLAALLQKYRPEQS